MPRRIERPYWFLDEDLAHLMGYSSRSGAVTAMREGRFPIPAFKLRGYWCVDREVVRRYFGRIRTEQLREFEHWVETGKYHYMPDEG